MSEHDDFLDFPGADELILAGRVTPPSAEKTTAVRTLLAQAAERDARLSRASDTMAVPDVPETGTEVVPAAARRDGPTAALAPPPDRPVVVLATPGPLGEPGAAPRRSRITRRRRVLIAAAAVAAIAVGTVAYPVLNVGGKPASTASAASAFLNDMAEVSEDAPATQAKYWRVHAETVKGGKKRAETWYVDRAGRTWIVDANGKAREWAENHAKWRVGGRHLIWPELDKLPTDPNALAARFAKDPAVRFYEVVHLLESSPASPELRSALFRVIADTPGVTLTPGVKDGRGRSGTAITKALKVIVHPADGGKRTFFWQTVRCVIDPETGHMLESSGTSTGENHSTWLEVGPADRIG
ncbi:CU044_5270 family protein [Streptomyces sp. NBC_00286]|uniref:CU044_5270 family protein n=1 Tax=Streptomyces sp. NBC_00286 TaxID=2975701 RepID=UPI002E2E3504|nr:CU044_5270 family protein [Streptomyces sp. NBC_00286]